MCSSRRSRSAACAIASCGRRSSSRPRCRARSFATGASRRRSSTSAAIRKKFEGAKIAIRAFNYSFNDSFTEPEIDRGFEMARALGAEFITASSTLDGGEAGRAVRREAQDDRRDAQPLEPQGSQRVRDARELRGRYGAVEVFQGEPRHRPLHGGELRRGRVSQASTTRASRTCTSRIASAIRATTCRGARATRRCAKSCSC